MVISDGDDVENTVIKSGWLYIYVWNSTVLQGYTQNLSSTAEHVNIPLVPGMKLNDKTKLTELMNNGVQSMDVLINKSVSVRSLIDKDMKLYQFLNVSLTVGELLDSKHIADIVTSENNTTIKQIMSMAGSIQKVLNASVSLLQLLDPNKSIMQIIGSNLPVSHVMNESLIAEIPFNDTILFNTYIEHSTKIVQIVNNSILVKDSFNYVEAFNESLILEDILMKDSILFRYRSVLKSVRTVNDSIDILDYFVNEVIESANDLNISLLNGGKISNETEQQLDYLLNGGKISNETEQQLDYLREACYKLDTIAINVRQITESLALLVTDKMTLSALVNETLKLDELAKQSFDGFQNISELIESIAGTTVEVNILPEFVALNKTFVTSYSQSETLKTEVQTMLLETSTFTDMVSYKWDKDIVILELLGTDVTLGDLLNTTINLSDLLISSVTLQDFEIAGNNVWEYLDEYVQVSYIVNDFGKSTHLVDVLERSAKIQNEISQANIFIPITTNDYLVRGYVSCYDILI